MNEREMQIGFLQAIWNTSNRNKRIDILGLAVPDMEVDLSILNKDLDDLPKEIFEGLITHQMKGIKKGKLYRLKVIG